MYLCYTDTSSCCTRCLIVLCVFGWGWGWGWGKLQTKCTVYDVYNFMAYHDFQMLGQFFTDDYIFDKSCCFQLLEKLGYYKKVVRSWNSHM